MDGTEAQRHDRLGSDRVGDLDALTEFEVTAVLYLRLWCSGAEAKAGIWSDFASALGDTEGGALMRAFEGVLVTMVENARRPLRRLSLPSTGIGADEAAFAEMMAAAAWGDREETVRLAAEIAAPSVATVIAAQAERAALGLRRVLMRREGGARSGRHVGQHVGRMPAMRPLRLPRPTHVIGTQRH